MVVVTYHIHCFFTASFIFQIFCFFFKLLFNNDFLYIFFFLVYLWLQQLISANSLYNIYSLSLSFSVCSVVFLVYLLCLLLVSPYRWVLLFFCCRFVYIFKRFVLLSNFVLVVMINNKNIKPKTGRVPISFFLLVFPFRTKQGTLANQQ